MKIATGTLHIAGRVRSGNCVGAERVVPTPVDGTTLVVNCADDGPVLLVDADRLKGTYEILVAALPIGIAVPIFSWSATALYDIRCARQRVTSDSRVVRPSRSQGVSREGILLRMVAEIFPGWNPLTSWMRQIEDFQRAA